MEKKGNYTETYKTTSGELDNQTKLAILEFHTLVCDIAGNVRKEVKPKKGYEELKADYLRVCNRYKKEQERSNDLLHMWKEETAKRLDAERERDFAQRHHKFVMNELSSILKEVECSSVRGIVDELKSERANGKLLAEENEMCRRENDKLKLNYEKTNKELEAQKDLVNKYVAKSEKLQSKLDKASMRYGELIKIISDKSIKAI